MNFEAKAGAISAMETQPVGQVKAVSGRLGVLLVNLGSPSGTDPASVRRYLRQFLSDPRVIETPRALWWIILNLFVLTTRPKKSGHAYEQIWNYERNEAPLITITRAQAEKLGAALAADRVVVDWAMRYGAPAIGDRLKALQQAGCERVLIAPLYPQYAAATTATAVDDAFKALARMRWQPAVRTLPPYYDAPAYIAALAETTSADLARLDFEPEIVLASFHGMPRSYVENGDPYERHCRETVRLLRERLGWSDDRLRLCFQSRFGRAEWLQPYTDETISELAKSGVRNLVVIMPGFSADCLETQEEIAIRGAKTFRKHGGDRFAALPCLNDSHPGIAMLEALVRRELSGWM